MVDHPRLTFGPRRLAVHPRAGGAARGEVEREIAATKVVIPAKAGIQYAEASRFNHRRLWNAGSPDPVYAEASTGYGSWAAEASAKVASRAMTVMGCGERPLTPRSKIEACQAVKNHCGC